MRRRPGLVAPRATGTYYQTYRFVIETRLSIAMKLHLCPFANWQDLANVLENKRFLEAKGRIRLLSHMGYQTWRREAV